MKREYSSGGVIIRRNAQGLSVLLIKDSYRHWTWPKGKIEKGETPADTALREIAEEVGLSKVRVIDKIDVVEYFYRRDQKLIFKSVYVFVLESEDGEEVRVQHAEIEDARWFSPAEALKKIDYTGAREVLQKALDRFQKVDRS